jgi:hypothetical protein
VGFCFSTLSFGYGFCLSFYISDKEAITGQKSIIIENTKRFFFKNNPKSGKKGCNFLLLVIQCM